MIARIGKLFNLVMKKANSLIPLLIVADVYIGILSLVIKFAVSEMVGQALVEVCGVTFLVSIISLVLIQRVEAYVFNSGVFVEKPPHFSDK